MGRTLNFDINEVSSQFLGRFEGIWRKPEEIPHMG